jgi:DNA-cytosine methyltransferase
MGRIRYLSLFTGIGGFENAIHELFDCDCVGFSEIDKHAIKVYTTHFPNHNNLGDVTKITREQISALGKIELVVAGFPCTNLSSMANINGDSRGLEGSKSGLFYDMLNILKWIVEINPTCKFIIENNYSMKKVWRETILKELETSFGYICNHMINNAWFGVQTRKRLIWTNFYFDIENASNSCTQDWNDVLDPVNECKSYMLSDQMINCLNKLHDIKTCGKTLIARKVGTLYTYDYLESKTQKSRWDIVGKSDTMSLPMYEHKKYPVGKSRPILCRTTGANNIVIDRRVSNDESTFIIRYFSPTEIERLFGYMPNYTSSITKVNRYKVLGNSVPIFIVRYVLKFMKDNNK